MNITYYTPATIEEMGEIANINTDGLKAKFQSQIETLHNLRAGDREINVCVLSSKLPDIDLPYPGCFLGWDGTPFIMVNLSSEVEDIRHGLLAVLANIDMLDSGDLLYHGNEGKTATYHGELFSEADALNHVTPYVQQLMAGELSQSEFSYRAIWSTPWALEAHREASKYYQPQYVL